jgi:D-alanine-D-alanine ligase
MQKLRVGIIFGGRSAEHEVSIQSAKNVFAALDREKYEPVLIGVTKKGQWLELSEYQFRYLMDGKRQAIAEDTAGRTIIGVKSQVARVIEGFNPSRLDVVFPLLHGPYGEDGTVQGLLRTFDLPFVGSDVLGSAVGMDKDVMKRLLRDAELPVTPFLVFKEHDKVITSYADVVEHLGLPFFVKPANLGSSVGVSKVSSKKEFVPALEEAFRFDRKILIEQAIQGRELECAVLGNDDPKTSVVGEIKPQGHDFYDYEAKYLDEHGAELIIPASLTEKELAQIQHLAVKAFKVLCAEGMARVDFFLSEDGKLYVNEINTIPGFTNISMYPRLWQASGVSYTELLDRLIQLALENHKTS